MNPLRFAIAVVLAGALGSVAGCRCDRSREQPIEVAKTPSERASDRQRFRVRGDARVSLRELFVDAGAPSTP